MKKKNHFWINYISFIKDQQKLQSVNTTVANDGIQSKVLRDKLAELEREIEKFRAENMNLDKLRKEREEVSMDFFIKKLQTYPILMGFFSILWIDCDKNIRKFSLNLIASKLV